MNPYIPSAPLPRDPGPGRRRDRYQLAVVGLTGLATAGSLAATGWLAGQAAHDWAAQQAPATTPAATTSTPVDPVGMTPRRTADRKDREDREDRVVLRDRPTRTRVSTQYVTAPAPVGGGGSVSSTPSQAHNPPPAPSSGS